MATEDGGLSSDKQPQGASYTYWVREATAEAAPLPVPRKLSSNDILSSHVSQPPVLGSVWNRAGTWEEKNLNKWATERMKDLLMSISSMEFSCGKAEIKDVSKCVGDMLMKLGEWVIREEQRIVNGHLDIPEFSFGELEDLQMEVRVGEEKDVLKQENMRICQDLTQFLAPVREKLVEFEEELKHR